MTRNGTNRRGFTLIEMVVAVFIIAMIFAISVPTINNMTRVHMRTAANKLAGNIKYLYDRAVLEKVYIRLVFDLDEGVYYPESTPDRYFLRKDPLEVEDGIVVKTEDELNEEEEEEEESIFDRLFSNDILGINPDPEEEEESYGPSTNWSGWDKFSERFKKKRAKFGGYQAELSKKEKLPKGVAIYRMYTPGLEEPVEHGQVYMHFFPHGYVEQAVIYLVEEDDLEAESEEDMGIWSLVVSPLTGLATIYNEPVEIPEPVMDEEEW